MTASNADQRCACGHVKEAHDMNNPNTFLLHRGLCPCEEFKPPPESAEIVECPNGCGGCSCHLHPPCNHCLEGHGRPVETPTEPADGGPFRKGSCVSNTFKTSLVLTTDEDVEIANWCHAQGFSAGVASERGKALQSHEALVVELKVAKETSDTLQTELGVALNDGTMARGLAEKFQVERDRLRKAIHEALLEISNLDGMDFEESYGWEKLRNGNRILEQALSATVSDRGEEK